jgi:glycosyltransferase involved in cell wall biosynthesis
MATYLQVFVEMGFQISFWPDNLGYDKEYALPLEELGIEVISCNGGFITFEEWIKKNGQHIDVAFLSRPYVALKYIQGLKENSKASIVFYGHDIHSLRTKGELEINPTDQALLARLANEEEAEVSCWEKCNLILYPSIDEKNHISEKFPLVNVDILPLYCKSDEEILTAKTITEFHKRNGILFVGGFDHSPNKDGILWFCNEIFPMIRKISPDVCLTIAGSSPPEEVSRLESNFIKITGRVSDQQLSAFYENHRVAIAPLRFGGGVKGKVVESMLKGVPMVTTKVGSQGLKATDKDLAIAYSECEFADKVIELLKDEKKWLQQRYSAETFFIENFSSRKIKNKLKKVLQ